MDLSSGQNDIILNLKLRIGYARDEAIYGFSSSKTNKKNKQINGD